MSLPFRKYSVDDCDTYPGFYMLTVTDPDGFKLVLERKLTYEVALHAALDFQTTEYHKYASALQAAGIRLPK